MNHLIVKVKLSHIYGNYVTFFSIKKKFNFLFQMTLKYYNDYITRYGFKKKYIYMYS